MAGAAAGPVVRRTGRVAAPVKLAAFPAPSVTVAESRLTPLTVRSAVFWPAPTVQLKGQGAGAGATGIGRGATIV
jgi:hypothetical protein